MHPLIVVQYSAESEEEDDDFIKKQHLHVCSFQIIKFHI